LTIFISKESTYKLPKERRKISGRNADAAEQVKGTSEQQISDKTGLIHLNVNRMFAGKYSPLLDNFIQLADTVRYHIVLKEN
jgi:hypothetical protein